MALNQNYPGLQEFLQNIAYRPGVTEVIAQPLYDYQVYPLAGVARMVFFQNPIGQGLSASPGNAGNPKQLSDTNMVQAGALPSPQAFFCTGIEVAFDPGSSAAANTFATRGPGAHVAVAAATVEAGEDDTNAVYSTGALTFTVSTKPYYQEGPLMRFPPSREFRMDCSMASDSATTAEELRAKLRVDGELCNLNPGVGIITSQNFDVTLTWPALVPTVSSNGRIGIILRGYLYRAVQ